MKEVIDKVNPSWDKDLIIRYLYIALAPFFERDLSFFFADLDTQEKIAKKITDCTGSKIVCKSLCIFYQKLYTSFGIDCQIIETNIKNVPHQALIVLGNNGWYYIDPLKDLMPNQVGLYSNFYGIIPKGRTKNLLKEYPFLITLPKEYLKELDTQLNLNYHGTYANAFFDALHDVLTTNKVKDYLKEYFGNIPIDNYQDIINLKIELINECIINFFQVPGSIERSQFYSYIATRLFNHTERGRLNINCSKDGTIRLLYDDSLEKELFVEVINSNNTKKLVREKNVQI